MLKIFRDYFLVLLTLISPKINTSILYKKRFGKKINLKKPKTFNEKISWLKLYEYPYKEIYSLCADKVAVREYVKKIGLSKILIPAIGMYNHAQEIDFSILPEKFVLKWNFGWGYNIICKDKKSINIAEVKQKLDKWENSKFYLKSSELHYKNISKKIICENYIGEDNNLPEDYKVYCFNGKAEYIMICTERETKHTKYYYFNRKWEICKLDKESLSLPNNYTIKKPKNVDLMFAYAEKLSKNFRFVRVDLYNVDGKIYFGELTFTPASGLDSYYTEEADLLLGSKIKL